MEPGQSITFTRKTFRYGNSVALVIPAQFDIDAKTSLKITIELVDKPSPM